MSRRTGCSSQPITPAALATGDWRLATSNWLWRALLWLALWQVGLRSWRKVWPRPRPSWLEWEPSVLLRRLLRTPERLVARLPLGPALRVIEVGAGTSRLTAALAARVGPTGQVIAADERLSIVERLQIIALEQGWSQVAAQQAPPTALPAAAASCDLVVLAATFGGVADKQALVAEAYRVLRPGGALAITEIIVDPDHSLASTVITHLVLAGFAVEREIGHFADYTIIGRKPGGSV